MRRGWPVLIMTLASLASWSAPPLGTSLYESGESFMPVNVVDKHALAVLQAHNTYPAPQCSDEVFVRRVYLDTIGAIPKPAETAAFLGDPIPGKRSALIDTLLEREEFADYWAMKWCDVLRVKAEFPINLWPNAVQAYHRWIRDAIHNNVPYDQFARELLTASGSNFKSPPVNFYRAIQGRTPSAIADAVALTFMGVRTANWPEKERTDIAAFFSRIAYKGTAEWKEEIVCLDPAPAGPLDVVFPDGVPLRIASNEDPRRLFAAWLISEDNNWFARNMANRLWYWLIGRGIVHEPDDFRPDNPPANPALLDCLAQELVHSHYDLKHLYRLILNSATYQQSTIPQGETAEAESLFGCYLVRRLDAEVLADALNDIFGGGEEYMSMIPEPFTYIPPSLRAITLADGSTTDSFLQMFGRPARDTGLAAERNNRVTTEQRLHLLNSSQIQRKIEKSAKFRQMLQGNGGNRTAAVRAVYMNILSRPATADETASVAEYVRTSGLSLPQAAGDLAWSLINSKEFLYRH